MDAKHGPHRGSPVFDGNDAAFEFFKVDIVPGDGAAGFPVVEVLGSGAGDAQ